MRVPIEFKGLHNSLAESKVPAGRAFAGQNFSVDLGTLGIGKRYTQIGARTGALATDVCFGLGYGKFGCNSTQSLTIIGTAPTSGTVTLQFGGHNAAAVNWNASASDVQTALVALSDFDEGEIVCFGGPWPTEPIYATLRGKYAGAAQALIVVNAFTLNNGAMCSIAHFVNGGNQEEYLVVIQPGGAGTCTLYSVTSSDTFASTTWASIATGLTASDWYFEQYSDKIYAVNSTDGILYRQLGGAWSGPSSSATLRAATLKPGVTTAFTSTSIDNLPGSGVDFTAATFASFTGWGTNPTVIAWQTVNLKVTLLASLAAQKVSFIATLPVALDWSYEDYWRLLMSMLTSGDVTIDPQSILMEFINGAGAPVTITPDYKLFPVSGGLNASQYMLFEQKQRSDRTNVVKIRFTFVITGANGKSFYINPTMWGSWLNDTKGSIDVINGPARKAIEYATSYYQTATGLETKLSPVASSLVVPQGNILGAWILVSQVGQTTLLNSDRIYYWRKSRFGQWVRFATAANSAAGATVTVTDHFMADELDSMMPNGSVALPGGFLPTALGVFKGSLAVASDRKIWLSYVGRPLFFAPDPDLFAAQSQLDPEDPNNPRTVFVALNRVDSAVSIIGQDSLYLGAPAVSHVMTSGDTPLGLGVPKPLPGSRGCIGSRGGAKLSGGALMAARDGLWYYAVSSAFMGLVTAGSIIEDEMSKEVRASWKTLFGSGPSSAVTVVFDEEIYAFAGTQYLKWTRNKQIEQGTLADSVKAAIPVQSNGFVWASSKGALMKFGDYTSDAGQVVSWSFSSGKIDGPRSRFVQAEIQYTGSPSVLLECWDGSGGYAFQRFDMVQGDGTVNVYPADTVIQGYRYRLTFSGKAADVIEDLALWFEDASKGGKGN